jgi:hypothetical protein
MKKQRIKKIFLESLSKNPIVKRVCEKHGISRQTVYRWREEDPDFASEMDVVVSEYEKDVTDMAYLQFVRKIGEGLWPAIKYELMSQHPRYKKDDVYSRRKYKKEEKLKLEEEEKQRQKEAWNLYINTPIKKELDDETIRRLGLT